MKKSVTALLVASTLSFTPAVFAEGPLDAENFSASVAFSTNYLFRGLSFSTDDPAVSGSIDWGYNGFYLGTWASSLEPTAGESFELDYYGGYAGEVGNFSYSLDYIYYDYPGDTRSLGYYEIGGSLAYSFDSTLAPTVGMLVMHTPDGFDNGGDATAVEAFLDLALPYELGLGVYYGNQDLDESILGIDDYSYYGVTLSKSLGKFDVTVGYSDTDSDGENFNWDNDSSEFYLTVGAAI